MSRIDLQPLGGGQTAVFHAHPQGIGLDGFDLWGQRVVRIDLLGQKVVEGQLGQEFDGNEIRRDHHALGLAAQGVVELGADEKELAGGRILGRPVGRNDQPMNLRRGCGGDGIVTIHIGDVVQAVDTDEELGVQIVGIGGGEDRQAVLILEVHRHLDVVDRQGIEAVVDAHHGIKGLALQRQLLLDLDLDLGADRACLAIAHEQQRQENPEPSHELSYFTITYPFKHAIPLT